MKWLVVPTQCFSGTAGGKETVSFADLPWPVRVYIKFFNKRVFVIGDECSFWKTTQAVPETKKSQRCRCIKLLKHYSAARCGMSGTLLSKSPLNAYDPYQALSDSFFANESMYDLAARYTIQMRLATARGRMVTISQKAYDKARKRMVNAYKLGGNEQLAYAMGRLDKELGLSVDDCEHILRHKKYTPYKHVDKLMQRLESVTVTVKREDIFDTSFDRKVYEPIMRDYRVQGKGLALGKELVKVGFTDRYTLGKVPALELMHRLQDICNGFEPVRDEELPDGWDDVGDEEYRAKCKVYFEPLPENPKMDALVELLEEINVEDNQTVIWCSRRNAFNSIGEKLDELGVPYGRYSGAQSAKQKAETERLVSSGKARVFLGNPAAGAFGLNALANCNYMIWYCLDAKVEHYIQAMHRILRGQSKTAKFAYMLRGKGTVEERNLASLTAGQELLSAANGKALFDFV